MELSAHHITTQKHWTDLSLNRSTLEQLSALKDSVQQQRAAIPGKANRQFAGLPVLFYGPSETDKSFTAAILGKELGLEVHSINISEVISKYIGETEKNLDHLFAHAADQAWILFFDEADALFGKRTESTNESDKFANQQVSYLLQRIEEYDGLVILSSNSKDNIDNAFIRRFHSVIHFPLSSATKKLNKNNPKGIPLE
jgi:SpoVK/Ycf46/Vps4 family AAA+-type ATPase